MGSAPRFLPRHNHRVGCLGEGRLGQNRTSDKSNGEGRYTTSDECLHMPILHLTEIVRELCKSQRPKGRCLHSGSGRSKAGSMCEKAHTSKKLNVFFILPNGSCIAK